MGERASYIVRGENEGRLVRERGSLPFSLSSLPSFFYFYLSSIFFLTTVEPPLTATSLRQQFFFSCGTVHTFTLVSTSLQWSLSSVRKVAVVERFTCTGTGYSRRARWPWTSACC